MDSGFPQKPLIIFVCEDDKHMAETFKTIVVNNVEIKDVPLYFYNRLKANIRKIRKNISKICNGFRNEKIQNRKSRHSNIKLII